MITTDRASAATELFARAGRDGSVELGELTEIEECVLGGGRWLLTDAAVWTTWQAALDDERRARHTRECVERLRERGDVLAVEETANDYVLALSAPLGIVQLARTAASFVLAGGTEVGPRNGEPHRETGVIAPLGYGLVDETAGGLRGLVTELRDHRVHHYRLHSPANAAKALARWLTGAVTSADYGGQAQAAWIEVLRHREGESEQGAGISVTRTDDGLRGAVLRFREERERFDADDHETLVAQVLTLLADTAQPTGEPL